MIHDKLYCEEKQSSNFFKIETSREEQSCEVDLTANIKKILHLQNQVRVANIQVVVKISYLFVIKLMAR